MFCLIRLSFYFPGLFFTFFNILFCHGTFVNNDESPEIRHGKGWKLRSPQPGWPQWSYFFRLPVHLRPPLSPSCAPGRTSPGEPSLAAGDRPQTELEPFYILSQQTDLISYPSKLILFEQMDDCF